MTNIFLFYAFKILENTNCKDILLGKYFGLYEVKHLNTRCKKLNCVPSFKALTIYNEVHPE